MSKMFKEDMKKFGFELKDQSSWIDLHTAKGKLVATLQIVDEFDYFKVISKKNWYITGPPPFRMLKIINAKNIEATILSQLFLTALMIANRYGYKVIMKDGEKILGIFYHNNLDYNFT